MNYLACVTLFLSASISCAQQAAPESLEQTAISPVKIEHRSDGVFFIDFGRDAFGQLKLQLDPAGDRKITVCLGEKLSDADHLDAKPGGSVRYLKTTIVDGRAKLTKADARRMPGDIGAVMPFRYVELAGLPEGSSTENLAKAVAQVAFNYPFDDSAALFTCSDEKLNAVWELCRYSMKATSYAGVFVDGDRERKPYEADAYINGLGWYCCAGDRTLPEFSDHYLIDHPTWPTEWSMFSVLCAWNDYLYTGDLNALREAYPDLKIKSLRALEREDGLISTENVPPSLQQSLHLGKEPMKDIVDWPMSERDSYEMKRINTVVNAFHCRSLALLSRMAEALGNKVESKDFEAAAEKSLASFNSKLFDPATGLYVDGEGSTHSSQHANMFPLAFGLVPADCRAKVVQFIKGRGMACSVYGAQFLMDGLCDNGAGNDAVALMLAPGDRSWRHMVEETGTTLTLEAWDQKYKPNQDWNHGWGAAPANLIPRKVLGVEPIEPGSSRVKIWPRCAVKSGIVNWARGKVPTAKGPVRVDWKASAVEFYLKFEVQPGVTAQVCLPPDWGTNVALDGKMTAGQIKDGVMTVDAGTGAHEIQIGK